MEIPTRRWRPTGSMHSRGGRRPATAFAVGVLVLLGTSCSSDDDDTAGAESTPVAIDMATDITTQVDVGEFTITEGADVVGCSTGRFFNTDQDDGSVSSTLTCESGPGEGDLKLQFEPTLVEGQEDEFEGSWTFTAGTGDFNGLEGGGELSALRDISVGTIDQTLTGDVAIAEGSEAETAEG